MRKTFQVLFVSPGKGTGAAAVLLAGDRLNLPDETGDWLVGFGPLIRLECGVRL